MCFRFVLQVRNTNFTLDLSIQLLDTSLLRAGATRVDITQRSICQAANTITQSKAARVAAEAILAQRYGRADAIQGVIGQSCETMTRARLRELATYQRGCVLRRVGASHVLICFLCVWLYVCRAQQHDLWPPMDRFSLGLHRVITLLDR